MISRRIKFRHIQCFVEIVREKSFKVAAEKLFVTQPAISKTLKELEDIIGTSLMRRNRSGIALTKQGEVFLHFAQMSLASLQQGLDGIEQLGISGKDKLSIGALPSVAAWLMPDVIKAFSLLAPNALVRIVDGPHGFLVDRLRQGKLDLVIGRLGRPETMQGISFTQLYKEQVCLVVRAGHPLIKTPDLNSIGAWQVIVPTQDSAIYSFVERFLIANGIGKLANRLETVSGAFGRVYTQKTDAVWFISRGVVENEIADGRLVELPFDMDGTQGSVGLMRRPEGAVTATQKLFELAVQQVLLEPR